MKIKNRKITDLIAAEYNPRELTPEQAKHLKDSLLRFGIVDPVIVNTHPERENIIVGGHQRTKVWESMGNTTIPTVEVNLTPEKERELNIRLNKNSGQWDEQALQEYFNTDELVEWGFDSEEVDFFEPETTEGLIDDDEIPEVTEAITKEGDLWLLGDHRLLCGDSTSVDDVDKLMNGEKADILITDPPYNVALGVESKEDAIARNRRTDGLIIQNDKMSDKDFLQFLNSFFDCALLEMKDGSPIYVFCPLEDGSFLNSFLNSGIKLQSILIWLKNSIVMGRKDYHYKHEPILYGWKKGATHKWYGEHNKSTIIECNKPPRNSEHPTMKPLELLETLLLNSSKREDLVLDVFLGSGTTLIASEKLNRKCYGMELDPHYCDVIVKRWEEYTGKKAERIKELVHA